ncbi:hypothetical protein B9Z55_008062 [Caenorhabditis nigoni]|uniref:Uncharacterized protein n=1 Tax=Caenorhabditis nigoni TaxID=1611254 RepID=A0A2G5VCG8_9PELO|nr:hypothetical protein B9Z55_008062 [Caenorhabditis nigoni]
MIFQVQSNRRLSAARKANEKDQGAKNEVRGAKNEGARSTSSPSRRDPADTKAWTAVGPSMSHQLCRIHPQKDVDRTLGRGSIWRKPEEFEGPGEEEEEKKKKKDTWMWMERREYLVKLI